MKSHFADYETSKMLKELGCDLIPLCIFYDNGKGQEIFWASQSDKSMPAFLWQQAEQWLWEKQKINIEQNLFYGNQKELRLNIYTEAFRDGNSIWFFRHKFETSNPITAKIEGIKAAVKYLHSKNI